MSVSVSIIEQVESTDDLPELLRHIATQIEGGMTSGYYPSWEIVENDDDE